MKFVLSVSVAKPWSPIKMSPERTTRFAQWGTKHGHAAGKLSALLTNPDVEVAGIYEPDNARRQAVANQEPWSEVKFFDDPAEILKEASITAVASEGANIESLDQTEALVNAGKHVWYDKPAGNDWEQWQRVVARARDQGTLLQMGFMFRYHPGFQQVAAWAHDGLLGDITSLRAHMSTNLPVENREAFSIFKGGIFYDLASHMLDQVVWLLGRPSKVTTFLHNDSEAKHCVDNSLGVIEYDGAIAFIDISAFETNPTARRFEVYGTKGSAIILEPFEPGNRIRLCLDETRGDYKAGEQIVEVESCTRQQLYELELEAILSVLSGERKPDRSYDHELLVQETLLRATGYI